MVLGTKELFDTMLAASGAGDVDTLEKRRAEFLEDDNNYALCVDSNGDTLLHKAVHPDPQTLLYVLDNLHARIDARNMLGKTALHEACKRNLLPCVNLLINRGADVLRTNEIGSTPFHTACSCGSVEAMERLLEIKDVDPNLVDGSGCFPIHKCSYDGNERVVDVLLKHNASIDVRDAQECTAVHIAVKMNRLDFVRKLLQIGEGQDFDINAGDKSGSTLLHYAVARCYHPMVKELLSRGADINKANEDGYTPLHIAAQSFQPDSQEWEDLVLDLLRMGADPNATNEMVGRTNGRRPVDYVSRNVQYLFDPKEYKRRDEIQQKLKEQADKQAAEEEECKKRFKEDIKRVHKERERVRREVVEHRRKEEEERAREEEARSRKEDEERAKELEELEAKKKKSKAKKKD